jgi:ribonucleoside-diphosphate reductase alpha chain
MKAAFWKPRDASASKTIDLPTAATPEDVNTAFQMSCDLRCKGVTVYRDGCGPEQPMGPSKNDHAQPSKLALLFPLVCSARPSRGISPIDFTKGLRPPLGH